jgi:hypothetical protein
MHQARLVFRILQSADFSVFESDGRYEGVLSSRWAYCSGK